MPMGRAMPVLLMLLVPFVVEASDSHDNTQGTCGSIKQVYKDHNCCGEPAHVPAFQVIPSLPVKSGTNVCIGRQPAAGSAYDNANCFEDGVREALEQAGANVTVGYQGDVNASNHPPITTSLFEAGLCPVNVHYHLGTEHLSMGQYDEAGVDPEGDYDLGSERQGHRCHHYNSADTKFTTEYNWQHCLGAHVGETYEIHWPHSAAGACGTPNQYQTPFYDGVFCRENVLTSTHTQIGVQAQVFTIVNDEAYYYPDLMRGMIVDGQYGSLITKYTGSTTGTSRNNVVCSFYTPITWQVDRQCHLISASSFDKMCADMKAQRDDMSGDLHAHGAREVVSDEIAANNHVDNRRLSEMVFD